MGREKEKQKKRIGYWSLRMAYIAIVIGYEMPARLMLCVGTCKSKTVGLHISIDDDTKATT